MDEAIQLFAGGLKPVSHSYVSWNPDDMAFYSAFYYLDCRFRGNDTADPSFRLNCYWPGNPAWQNGTCQEIPAGRLSTYSTPTVPTTE